MAKILAFYRQIICKTSKLTNLNYLIIRVSMGWIFTSSGWGKLQSIQEVIHYFKYLGVPSAEILAPMVACIELVGGLALILGLGTRVFSFLLSSIMVVALMTAHKEDISSFADLFKIYEYSYVLMLLVLLANGAGLISLDYVVKKKTRSR